MIETGFVVPRPMPVPMPMPQPAPVPIPAPFPSPNPLPVPLPNPDPVRPENKSCPVGGSIPVLKDPYEKPKFPVKPLPRRRRHCPGGREPKVWHTRRERYVGWFSVVSMDQLPLFAFLTRFPLKNRATETRQFERWLKENGYRPDDKSGLFPEKERVVILDVRPTTPFELFKDLVNTPELMGADHEFMARCFYKVFEIGKRRHCKCPDGSKCKPTVNREPNNNLGIPLGGKTVGTSTPKARPDERDMIPQHVLDELIDLDQPFPDWSFERLDG